LFLREDGRCGWSDEDLGPVGVDSAYANAVFRLVYFGSPRVGTVVAMVK